MKILFNKFVKDNKRPKNENNASNNLKMPEFMSIDIGE